MQKCIEVISVKAKEAEFRSGQAGLSISMAERIQFIVDDVLANVESLCCHPYGCRVLQRMLEHCVECQKLATLDEIQLCHKTLLDDQYGNYVIQHVLRKYWETFHPLIHSVLTLSSPVLPSFVAEYGRDSDRDSLLKIILDNDLLKLSRQKFASNVVEKLLKYGNSYQRNAIVREMLKVSAIFFIDSFLLDKCWLVL
jgi:pumilio RNA-binding family